jgi:hypothetical protein
MTDAEYFAAPGLSNSAMKDMAVSPLRFWHKQVNPARVPDEPTAEMRLGSALHCAILRPKDFDREYCCELVPPENALDTIQDLRSFLVNCGRKPMGTRKDEIIAQVQMVSPNAPILSVLEDRYAIANAGKVIFKQADWQRIAGMAKALMDEPHVQRLLSEGSPEVVVFGKDPDTGVPLKAKIDWWRDDCTVDFKTFTHRDGKTMDRSIADDILYRAYYRQAYFYSLLRGWPEWSGPFVMPFVESDEPHEARIRSLSAGEHLYWKRAEVEVRQYIRMYAECMDKFGVDKPWRWAQDIRPLEDEEMPGLAW